MIIAIILAILLSLLLLFLLILSLILLSSSSSSLLLLHQVKRVVLTKISDHAGMNAIFSYRDQSTSSKIL